MKTNTAFAVMAASALALTAVPARAAEGDIRPHGGFWPRWEVDPDVTVRGDLGTPEVRARLVPVLSDAYARRAIGYDQLRAAVCTNDGAVTGERAHACSTLPTLAEDEWQRTERTNQWIVRVTATAVYAGAITAAIVERDHESSRTIVAASAFPLGALGGLAFGSLAAAPFSSSPGTKDSTAHTVLATALALGGGIVGGVLASRRGYYHASSPGATTAAWLTVPYLTTLMMTMD